jgi:hypothetical protein
MKIEIHVHHHQAGPDYSAIMDMLSQVLRNQQSMETKMADETNALNDLTTAVTNLGDKVTAEATEVGTAIGEIQSLAAQIAALPTGTDNSAAIEDLVAKINVAASTASTSTDNITAAVAAVQPAPPADGDAAAE